ncbi:sensor domain-containing diguanylate cyclase [Paenibacillus caui]|uniref:sensor domain-containing diguanylate cyclase n=1 Tax=Paenibacillus caui TaxID=2873927 RepID=UPI001CA7F962|nr:sensor domain-containing diguanylate cyclase [Paenibacillus caui]
MAEYLREDRTEHHINTFLRNGNPQIARDATAWLDDMDVTKHDFPYIETLIQRAFSIWTQEALPVPGMEEARWLLADHAGKLIAGTEGRSGPEVEAGRLAAESARVTGEPQIVAFSGVEAAAVPLRTRLQGEIFGSLVCLADNLTASLALTAVSARHFRTCFYQQLKYVFLSDLFNLREQKEREEAARWTALLQIVKRMHDKIDVNSVLTEVFESMTDIYPGAQLELLISQDYRSSDPRVKLLQMNTLNEDEKLCIRAYMQNTMLSKDKMSESGAKTLEIAVPLSGKQGVYGVFHFLIPGELGKDMDLQLVSMLADTAGNAFENAKLYEQSNLLIHELRLINELSRQLSQSLQPAEVFEFATKELLDVFKADYCCITEFNPDKDHFQVMSTNVLSMENELFPASYGYCGVVYTTGEPLIMSDYNALSKVHSKMMESTGSKSLIAAPVTIRGEVSGAILLSHRQAHYFSYENYKLLQVLATHIGLAIANASLYDAVQFMANRDMLTGLYARHYLDDCVQQRLQTDNAGSLLIVDIDNFKQVNDSYGHQAGDRILKQVCDIIKSQAQPVDIAARWGGEELAVYFPFMTAEECFAVSERIRERVIAETHPGVTVSCGVGGWTYSGERISAEVLFYCADMALYKAKNGGRNRTEVDRCGEGLEGISLLFPSKDAP